MPKQLNVNLAFTADTSQAKKQLQDLQNQLTKLTNNSLGNSKLGITKEIQDATAAAAQLKVQLENATNVNTGKLDLGKFVESMKESGMDLEQYRKQLSALGPEGSKAFLSLAQSISNAEMPLRRSSALLDQFWTTLKNTARWQISSSVLHGFMGAIQGAYGYAQDLNKSLTSIAIVTGNSVDNMRDFAEQANKSAQALSTSTLAYTDAALIYYQQGLQGQEVADRVETTLKMSNVTGESAEEVSSYMTAIWNNFRKGGEDLESFADKITALGAATASSSREIAGGLQQFAAIADTVGLSYDYAATALATVVAQTRQSESTVGNAFRTIFSRLEGLKLGETLEDGTDLNKYSAALETIGVNIKDQNGELRQMDGILDDIGARWQTLSRDQQMALAQTVGGVRQYANLIALFDNWDTFQKNLQVSLNADGTLQEQADIYAESWEAAQKRVKAAWQGIYQSLIDDKFFITMLNGLQNVLNGINDLIKSAGGLKGVLAALGVVLTSVFSSQLEKTINDISYNMTMMSASGRQKLEETRQQSWEEARKINMDTATPTGAAQATVLDNTITLQQSLYENAKHMTDEEIKQNQLLLDANQILQQRHVESAKALEDLEKQTEELENQARRESMREGKGVDRKTFNTERNKLQSETESYAGVTAGLKQISNLLETGKGSVEDFDNALSTLYDNQHKDTHISEDLAQSLTKIIKINEDGSVSINKSCEDYEKLRQKIQETADTVEDGWIEAQDEFIVNTNSTLKTTDALAMSYKNTADKQREVTQTGQDLAKNQDYLITKFQQVTVAAQQFSASLVTTVQGLSQIVMAISSFENVIKTIKDEDLSPWEKFKSIIPSLAMGLPAIINGLKLLNKGTGIFSALSNGAGAFFGILQSGKGMSAAFSGAIGSASVTLTGFAAALAQVLIPLGLLAGALYVAYRATHQEEIALKKAEEAVRESKKAWEEAQQAYDNLYSSLTAYQDGLNALEKLKKGTVEWTQAVADLNNKVLELMELYPELAGYITSEDGILKISQEGMQALIDKQYTEAMQKQLDYVHDNFNLSEAKQDLAYKDAGKEITYTSSGNGGMAAGGVQQNISKDIMRAAAEVWGENSSLFNKGNTDELISALKEHGASLGNDAQVIAEALSEQQAVVADVYGKNIAFAGQADALMDSLYQQVINTELQPYEKNLDKADADLYNDFFQRQLEQEVGKLSTEEQENLTIQDIAGMLRDLVSRYQSPEEARQAVENDRLSQMGDQLIENRGPRSDYDNTQFRDSLREYYDSLSDEDKKIFLTLDIDKETSWTQLDEKMAEAKQLIKDNIEGIRATLDEDVGEDEWEEMTNFLNNENNINAINELGKSTEKLSEDLAHSKSAAAELAQAMLRFDDAIQNVEDNYEEWMDMLNSDSVQDQIEAANQLKETYADLFDISEKGISTDFALDPENLELMKQACEGVEGAYDELMQKMGEDIAGEVYLDTSQFERDKQYIIEEMLGLSQQEFDALEVGAELNDTEFLRGLSEMLTAAGMTAEQAQAYLASMGIDAKVTQHDNEAEEVNEVVGFEPHLQEVSGKGHNAHYEGDTLIPDEWDYNFAGVTYTADPVKEITKKQSTGWTLEVESATKKSGGNFKYQHAKHGGGSSGAGNTRDSGKKGGGGGSKKKTVKEHTKREKGEDRYHNIKSAINEVSKALERLNKLQDRAYGKARLKYMDQTIDKLKDQVRLTDIYIDEAKKYLSLDRGRLEGLGMGAEFTEDGRLLNYEQVYQNIIGSYNGVIDAYNGAIDQFNASAQEDADNQMLDNAKKQLDNAKEIYDNNKEILKQYEDTYSTLQEQMDKRVDLLNQIYDAKLAKVVWKVDIQLEVNDADLEVLDWINKYIQKDSKKAADSIANLSKQMGLFGKNITAVNGGLDELFENHGIKNYEDLTAEQLVDRLRSWQNAEGLGSEITQAEADQIREWMTALMGYADDMLEAFEEAHEQVDKALDSWNDKLDEQIQKFDDLRDFLDSYNDIINLTGQRMLGMSDQDLADIDRSIVSNSQNRLESLRRIMEENQTNLNRMRAVDTSGYTEDALREWEENIKHAEEVATESTKNYWDGFKQSLEDGETAYNNAMDRMAAQYKRTLGNLDFLSERFSRQQEVDHLYLDDYEKYNAINKDMAELSKNLEKTNNLALKSKIKDFQDELNDAMSTGVRISQRQADIYERRVALLQAEAELLNAQNAKSAVRMTRDNEGNFSYTYTADQDAIDAAEENYSTSFYDYLKYMRDNQEELQNEQIQKMSQYMDDLTALYQAFYDGEITDLDAALAELNAQYDEYREYFIDQETMLFDEMGRLRDEDWEFAQEITGLKLAEEDDFITDFSDTLVGRLEPTYQTAEGWAMEWAEAIADSNTSARESLNLWYQDVNTTYKAAGTTVDNFRDLVKADLTAINQASNDTKTATDQMAIAMDNDMNNVIKKAVDMDRYWSTVMNDVRNQIEATVLKMNDMLRQLANIEDYEYRAGNGAEVARGAFAGMGDAAGSAVEPLNNMADALNNAAGAARNLKDALGGGGDNTPTLRSREISATAGSQWFERLTYSDGSVEVRRTGTGFANYIGAAKGSFDTGGYTGSWGPEGRFAMLHEKELVLNKEDTANILSVVDTVRGLANQFDISNGLNQFAKSILGSSQLAMAGTGSLNQNVHIEANFPNVESHNEIEMALNNLINSASQYVNRK